MSIARRSVVAATLSWLAAPVAAESPIAVEQPWARSTPAVAKIGAAYFTLRNAGSVVDRLIAVDSPAAGKAEMHATIMDGGVARMRQVASVDIAPGGATAFRPGALHVMLIDLKAPLVAGQRVPLTLVFEQAGRVDIVADILDRPPAASGHAH